MGRATRPVREHTGPMMNIDGGSLVVFVGWVGQGSQPLEVGWLR